jgi:hypothetical protein
MKFNSHGERLEAHEQAGEEFANALRKSFPSIAEQITDDATISFHGKLRGRDVVCTFEQIKEQNPEYASTFSAHYDPTVPEVRERRKRLFQSIEAGRSEDSASAARELAQAYSGIDPEP